MEQELCGLCRTPINKGAIVCTGCGAVKQKYMPKNESRAYFWAPIFLIVLSLAIGNNLLTNIALFTLPIGAILFVIRFFTRKYYWVRR